MLTRSKNKMHIVNIENGVVSAEGDGTVTFRAGKIRVVLGEYSSAKKAFKVLDMIQEAYAYEKLVDYTTYLQQKEIEKMDDSTILALRNELMKKAVFQIPVDSEVEV